MVEKSPQVRPKWTQLKDLTKEDLERLEKADEAWSSALPDRIIDHLNVLRGRGGNDGFPIDRLTHLLQTATRAQRDGQDEEYVVCCLLHDVGDVLSPYSHADVSAAILEPFVSEENRWMVKHHPIFQGYYYFHHLGMDRNARDRFKDHPAYERTVRFCEYDQASFDPDYDTLPLESFEAMIRRVFSQRPKWATNDRDGMTANELQGLLGT